MNLAQENFERAHLSAAETIRDLYGNRPIDLSSRSTNNLRTMSWDLEAIGAAIRLELMNREQQEPVDLG